MAMVQRRPMPLPEYRESQDSNEDVIQLEEETSQNWLLRHLRLILEDVEDVHLTNFIHKQDITIFRNFMMAPTTDRRCLFITVVRNFRLPFDGPQAIHKNGAQKFQPKKIEPIKKPMKKIMHQPGKLAKPKNIVKKPTSKKPAAKRSLSKTKSASKLTESLPKINNSLKKSEDPAKDSSETAVDKELLQELMQLEIKDSSHLLLVPEILLKWQDAERIPSENEFIYVATRDQPKMDEKNEFDQLYLVGYVRNSDRYKKLLEISRLILRDKLTFERQMDMLFMSQNLNSSKREKWQDSKYAFENFISDSLCYAFWMARKQSLPTDDIDVESIEALLRPRIKNFVINPNQQNLTQLWLELSLYEIKFLAGPSIGDTCASRLIRMHTIFSALQLLYSGDNKEWLQKTVFYTIELICRIFATKIKENAKKFLVLYGNLGFEDEEEEFLEEQENLVDLKKIFVEFLKLGGSIFYERNEEFGCLERIKQCMRIIDYIEEELEKIKKLTTDLNDPKRDMMLDRTGMDQSYEIVQEIWNVFEESYFESSLETGNFESLKNVCLQLSMLQNKLKEAIPPLDEYCS